MGGPQATMRRPALLLALLAVAASGPPAGRATATAGPPPSGSVALPAAATSQPGWKTRIDGLAAGKTIGISLRDDGQFLYRRADTKRRTPASNQKLLLAMALMDRVDLDARLETMAKVGSVNQNGVVPGNLWLVGRGDPNVGPAKLGNLAAKIQAAGISRVKGSVVGAISYFAHDWWAPGWKPYFPEEHIPLPSALTFQGNQIGGTHIADPERRAALVLTRRLRARGVQVSGPAEMAGNPPQGLDEVASVRSPRLLVLVRKMLRPSSNFRAELLGKMLAVERLGVPGTIAKGAASIEAWAQNAAGVGVTALDCSGLSYSNRVTPRGIVRLLAEAEDAPWGQDLLEALPGPGQGTLGGRLQGIPVKAKTGTLTEISTLSGWVYLKRTGSWAEFSIMSRGMSTDAAKALEEKIVRIMWRDAR
jgi:serine-type D-Ala-D-Ala carboxypeptidase/endopeptidase (penicillin-binding protein 4)